jgi:hypothetical protein
VSFYLYSVKKSLISSVHGAIMPSLSITLLAGLLQHLREGPEDRQAGEKGEGGRRELMINREIIIIFTESLNQ